jgi:predicted nuclease of predicted toxin-antitoxin system
MLRLICDEDVHGDIIPGLWLREPKLDIVDARDVGLGHTRDPLILEWAAANGRVLITGDLNTMVGLAEDRVRAGLPMPGVLALLENKCNGRVLDCILMAADCCSAEEINFRIIYIPF